MSDLILSEKINQARRRESLDNLLSRLNDLTTGLEVELEVLGTTENNWPIIRISGPDEEISKNMLRSKIGFVTTKALSLGLNAVVKAFVVKIDSRANAIVFDAGLDTQENAMLHYRASDLRAQLFDGESLSLPTMAAKYCLHPGIPFGIRIPTPYYESGIVPVMLSDHQVNLFREWENEPFERLMIRDAFFHEVTRAIADMEMMRDLADISEISLMVSVLTCKLGTKARGLIPRLGPLLRNATFYTYHKSPE